MADYSGDLKYRITVDGAEASQAKLSKLGASFKSIASTVALSVAAMATLRQAVRLAGDAMQAYEEAIKAVRQLDATLASTGRSAEFSSQELQQMATELQKISNYGDEEILTGVTASLLRFDSISKDIFPRAQSLVIDLAESMGGVENAARTLGISLADPTLGLTRLRRIGVAFNSTQEAQIKNFMETGRVAEAQAVLMQALESRFGGLATASVSATTQMKNAWGDYLEGLGESLAFIDGIKRGVTASLIDMAGQYDITSKQARLAALDTQQAWGEAVINVVNYGKMGLSIVGGSVTAVWLAVKGVLDLIPRAMWVTFEAGKQAVVDVINGMVDAIIDPFEMLFGIIDKSLTAIGHKGFGFDAIFSDLRKSLELADSNVVSASESLINSLSKTGSAFSNWGANVTATGENTAHSIYEQTKILTAGIEAQRKAIEQGLTGVDVPDLDFGDINVGVNVDTTGVDNYYSTVMALNNTASQQIMDKYNEMRVALSEYLRANTESQEEYQNKLRLGQAEIAKAETQELMAEREKQLSDLSKFVDAVSGLNVSEVDGIKSKYAEMRNEAEGFYREGLISEQAYQSALAQIRQAEGEEIKSFERQRLDFRVQTLAGITGLESSYMAERLKQIELETEKLREAGLTEVEIHAWVQEQKLALETEIDQRRIDQMSEYERYVLDSNQRIMDTLEGSLANSLASMISGTKSALDVWKSLWANIAQSIIAEISKIIVKALFANALLKGLGIATGNIGSFFGIGAGATTQSQGFIGPVNQADFDPFAILSAIDNNANQTTSALDELNNTIMNLSLSPRIMIGQPAIENTLEPNIFVSAPDAPTVNVDVNPILSFSPEFMPQISLNPQIQNYVDIPQTVNNIAMPEIINRFQMPNIIIPQQQSIDLSPLAHILDSIMLARQERTDLQSYGVTEMMTNTVIRQERDNRALDSLSERIEKLATAIENNKPQIYTQVIEGVPFNNAIRRAAAVANEL